MGIQVVLFHKAWLSTTKTNDCTTVHYEFNPEDGTLCPKIYNK